jgi:Flp pilus assembly protein protease CpaA
MTETPLQEPELPPSLRFLKHLVTVLTVTMIVGVITVVAVLVTRLQQVSPPPGLPASITLPPGSQARAVTMGTGWIAVVTADDHILIYATDGTLRQDIPILPIAD